MKELIEIQNRLNAPKSRVNKFGGYNYRNCEDILDGLKPLLLEQHCTLIITDEVVQVGSRYYVKATATITNSEGKSQTVTALAREEEDKKGMDAAQITGACSSYARKYALNGLFLIDDSQDPDTQPPKETATKTPEKPKETTKEEPKTTFNLESAKKEVEKAKTSADVMRIWVDNKEWQGIPAFKELITKTGSELKKKENVKTE